MISEFSSPVLADKKANAARIIALADAAWAELKPLIVETIEWAEELEQVAAYERSQENTVVVRKPFAKR